MPTEMEIEQAKKCEFRKPCCEAGHLCEHKSRRRAMQLNWHCEDLVNGEMCPFISGELMERIPDGHAAAPNETG
jgi:hypothetical protein